MITGFRPRPILSLVATQQETVVLFCRRHGSASSPSGEPVTAGTETVAGSWSTTLDSIPQPMGGNKQAADGQPKVDLFVGIFVRNLLYSCIRIGL